MSLTLSKLPFKNPKKRRDRLGPAGAAQPRAFCSEVSLRHWPKSMRPMRPSGLVFPLFPVFERETGRHADRQPRQTGRQPEPVSQEARQAGSQADGQPGRQAGRQTNR